MTKSAEYFPEVSICVELVAAKTHVAHDRIFGSRRDREGTFARQLCMFLLIRASGMSLPQIARAFGKADHSTVIYARKRVEEWAKGGDAQGLLKLEADLRDALVDVNAPARAWNAAKEAADLLGSALDKLNTALGAR